jgi:hypothetical protein
MGKDGEAVNYEHQSLSKMKKQKETVKKELKLFEVHFDKFYGRSVFPSLLVASIPRRSYHSHSTDPFLDAAIIPILLTHSSTQLSFPFY